METINTMANAATKAIWGTNEAKEEPVSGVAGNTSNGEPYDAGNIEDQQKKAHVADVHTEPNAATSTPAVAPTTAPSATEDFLRHEEEIGKPELKKQSADDAAPHDSTAGKTDTRPPTDPTTDPKPKGQDVSTKSGTGPTNEGDKLDGPGPRPLEAVAKERGGDAGNTKSTSSGGGLTGDAAAEEEDGPQKKSHGEGTGEKYVKSTGLAADGGDFDATKPGAGREADRLLDEKNPAAAAAAKAAAAKTSSSSHSNDSGSAERTHSPNDGTEKEKKSLGDKIKAKLHRH